MTKGCAYVRGKRGAVSSVVEHHLDTVGVTGSSPVSRTTLEGGSFDKEERAVTIRKTYVYEKFAHVTQLQGRLHTD